MRYLILSVLFAGLALGCEREVAEADEFVEVTGTVTYRERIALPPDATLDVRIQDRAGEVLADTVFGVNTQVPIPFTIDVPAARIDTSRAYAVSARLEAAEGQMLWTTPAPELVLTRGEPRHRDLVLEAERRPQAPMAEPWRHARERGVAFRALGQEPEWMLDVYGAVFSPDRLILEIDNRMLQFDQIIRDEDGEGNLRYRASAADVRLEAIVEDRLCHDVRTGEEFEAVVSVRLNERAFDGCGRGLY